MKRIYYITNMFPGKHDNYGIFCKKTYDFFVSSEQFEITGFSGLRGKSYNKLWNVIRYCILLLSIFNNLIFRIRKIDIVYIQYVWKHAFFITRFFKRIEKNKIKMFINFHGEDLTDFDLLSYGGKRDISNMRKSPLWLQIQKDGIPIYDQRAETV